MATTVMFKDARCKSRKEKDMKTFKRICRMRKDTLKKWLEKQLRTKYKEVINEDGFLYARGSDVLLTAHMDTVHTNVCRDIIVEKEKGRTVLSSPQGIGGDDRCGIWMILNILKRTKYRPSILFCEDEEIGGVGSGKFVETEYIKELESLKYLIELDRAHDVDAVFYDCGNADFKEYVESFGLKEDYGSFSDIGHLSPACDRASVNISCGYYNQHTLEEYVVFEEMVESCKVVCNMLKDAKDADTYDYQEERWNYRRGRYGYGYGYDYSSLLKKYYFADEDEEEYETVDSKSFVEEEEYTPHTSWEFMYRDENNKDSYDICVAKSFEEAVGRFLVQNPNIKWNDVYDWFTYEY